MIKAEISCFSEINLFSASISSQFLVVVSVMWIKMENLAKNKIKVRLGYRFLE